MSHELSDYSVVFVWQRRQQLVGEFAEKSFIITDINKSHREARECGLSINSLSQISQLFNNLYFNMTCYIVIMYVRTFSFPSALFSIFPKILGGWKGKTFWVTWYFISTGSHLVFKNKNIFVFIIDCFKWVMRLVKRFKQSPANIVERCT